MRRPYSGEVPAITEAAATATPPATHMGRVREPISGGNPRRQAISAHAPHGLGFLQQLKAAPVTRPKAPGVKTPNKREAGRLQPAGRVEHRITAECGDLVAIPTRATLPRDAGPAAALTAPGAPPASVTAAGPGGRFSHASHSGLQ